MAQATRPTTQRKPSTTASTRTRSTTGSSSARPFNMPFEQKNILFILGGVAVIALGYIIMGSGDPLGSTSLNLSPVVLLLGYLVVVPLGIMYGSKRKKKAETNNSTPSA